MQQDTMLSLAIRYGRELTVQFNFLQLNACILFLSLHSAKLKEMQEKAKKEKQLKHSPPAPQHPWSSPGLVPFGLAQPTRFPHLKSWLAQKIWANSNPWLKPPSNPILSGLGIFKHRHCTEQSKSRVTSPFRRLFRYVYPQSTPSFTARPRAAYRIQY